MQNTLSTSRARRDELARPRADLPTLPSIPAGDSAPVGNAADEARQAENVRDWLLAILRYAVTLEQSDRAAVTTIAQDLDGAGSRRGRTGFCFFSRTSSEFCSAIANRNDPQAASALAHHFRLIDNLRLRRALEAAIGDDRPTATPRVPKRSNHEGLWKGLRQS